MKNILENLSNKLNKSVEFFKYKLKNSNSFVYSLVVISAIVGYGFFFNSNAVLKDDGVNYTTPLFEVKKVETSNVELRARKYCKSSNTVEFYIFVEDGTALSNNILDFELKERSTPSEKLKLNVRRLDKNNYIVRSEVPKKWTVLSLGVYSFNPLDVSKNSKTEIENNDTSEKNNAIKNTIKFYSEYDDMDKVSNLDMKKTDEYLYEGAELEIESVNKKIDGINKSVKEKNATIDSYNENINRLNEDKVYQIESEKQSTDSKILSIESIINNENDNLEKLEKEKKLLKEKIQKLEDKKRNLNI